MFSREKLRKILTTQNEEFTKNTIKNYDKFNMNSSIKSINTKNKKLNLHNDALEKSCKQASKIKKNDDDDDHKINADNKVGGRISNNLDDDVNEDFFFGNDKIITGDYYSDDNNMIVGAVALRKSKTPIESINLHDMDFGFVKKNKNYATEDEEVKSVGGSKNSTEDTFQRAVSPILFLGQCFALMPVMNILNPNPKRLKFSYKSIQIMVWLFFMCSSSILTLTQLKYLSRIGINAKNLVGLVFFSCVQCSCTLFAALAPRWPKMMRYWSRVESTFTQPPYEMPKGGLSKRVRLAAFIIIFCSAVEHGMYLSSAIISYRRSIELCAPYRNDTREISFEDYIVRNYDYVFEILTFNIFVALFILIINGACTFIWNYMDLFIMMISKGLAYRFEQITTRINKLANKEVPETVFVEIREHYVKLCELLEFIDENLSGIILLSCMNNLYFVCYQLLNVFNKLRWPINYIYFWYSLLYLIGRTAFVFLTAAAINDQAKGGLAVLRKVSSRTWCVEVERLIFLMTTQTVALSGKKFYYLTRRLLFGMAGTIVTYELVLLQFDEPNRSKGLPDLCA